MSSAMTKRLERLEQKSGTTIESEIERLPYAMKLVILKRVREEIAAQKAGKCDACPIGGDYDAEVFGFLRQFREEFEVAKGS
jgi:hypothetical protein